ncbi:MAG TPA: hypothetical protein VGL56_07760 [Fimbriimonadaceae bacterium]|jgi:hypothetical protein
MNKGNRKIKSKKSGTALVAVLGTLFLLCLASVSFIGSATQQARVALHYTFDIQTYQLCEAGSQEELLSFWNPFQNNQNYTTMDPALTGASVNAPLASVNDSIPGVGNFSTGVISYQIVDSYTRTMTIRSVGWIDEAGTGKLQAGDPRRTLDLNVTFQLSRSKVFDYTYFVNNYGWMDGFGPNDLIVNGDMRANGNFSFTDGSPTVNGSVYASYNNLLIPAAQGNVSGTPYKWDNNTYDSNETSQPRWRQGYSSAQEGSQGSSTYNTWAPFIFDSNAGIFNNTLDGASLNDVSGAKSWQYEVNGNASFNMLDSTPTQQVIMPDLSDLSLYENLSSSYTDPKQNYGDGTPNPFYGQPSYVQTWNSSTNSYQTITTNGILTGSAAMIGTQQHPIVIHGPVTFTQDAVIEGYVSGQGTVYAGRNVHIDGSIIYANPPDFRGANLTATQNSNEKCDCLGLAARASIIMGDTSGFSNPYPLSYMMPPFTNPRYDSNGNLIPAYDATAVDSTGNMCYQSVLGDAFIHSIAQPVNQIDAVMYTNFVGGGNIGTGGAGLTINGTIISRDEAMVIWSLPMLENYDNRIKETSLSQAPLIDLQLPRSPTLTTNTWQDQGFSMGE